MILSIGQFTTRAVVFILSEVVLCVSLVFLLGTGLTNTGNISRDIFVGLASFVVACTIPVWLIGYFHLRSVGLLRNYWKAVGISAGLTAVVLGTSALWYVLFSLALLMPVVWFNVIGLRRGKALSSQPS